MYSLLFLISLWYEVPPVCFEGWSFTRLRRQKEVFPSFCHWHCTHLTCPAGAALLALSLWRQGMAMFTGFYYFSFFTALWLCMLVPCNWLPRPIVNVIRIRLSKSFYVYEPLSEISCSCFYVSLDSRVFEPKLNKWCGVIFTLLFRQISAYEQQLYSNKAMFTTWF